MADDSIQSKLSRIAQGFSSALGSQEEAPTCPHCGQAMPSPDDVPEPNKKDAEAFSKGMSERPDYVSNVKKGLGLD